MASAPWRYQPITERRQRDSEEFQTYADQRMQEMEQDSGGGGLLGGISDFASGAADVAGDVGGAISDIPGVSEAGSAVSSVPGASEAGGLLRDFGQGIVEDPLPGIENVFSGEALQRNLGIDTSYLDQMRQQGLLGQAGAMGIDVATAPITALTAGAGGGLAGALRAGGSTSGRLAAGLVEPVAGSGFGGRFASEVALGTGAHAASKAASQVTDNPALQIGAGFAGGAATAGGIGRAFGRGAFQQGSQTATEQAGRTAARQVEDTGQLGNTTIGGSGERMFPWLSEERRSPLRQRDYAMNSIKRTLGVGAPEDPIMTPISREYETQRSVVPESQATLVSQRAAQYEDLFKGQIDEDGLIDIGPAPASMEDIMARYPEYRPYLTDDQSRFIEGVGDVFKRMKIEMEDAGIKVHTRPDVMEGGYYVPRGSAAQAGWDAPKKASAGSRGGKTGSLRPARFESKAEGIQKGYEYTPFEENVYEYIKRNGELIYDHQLGNVLRETVGPDGAERLGKTVVDRMDPKIREQYQSVRQQMVRVRDKIRRSETRAGVESRASDELDTALESVVRGTPTEGFRDVSRIPARMRQQGRRAEGLQGRSAELRSETMRSPEGFPEARISMQPTESALRRADVSDIRAEEVERTLRSVDELVSEDLERVRFMDTAIKNTAQRAEKLAQRGGQAGRRAQSLKDELTRLQEEFDRLKGPYRKELERARATPPDQQTIVLSNMNGWTFPVEAAEAINKRIRTEEGWFEKSTDYVNQILRALASTADHSAPGIHGLLAGSNAPRAFAKAVLASSRAFIDPDIARRTISELDNVYRQKGQLTSEDWAASKLHFGSTRTEFTPHGNTISHRLAQIQNLPKWTVAGPVIRASSRAFGGFGDIMRLQLANSIYERAAKQGIDVSTRKAREEIAMTANLMTGWSPGRLAGKFGAFGSYAPRMYQAQFDITGKALANGDISGKEARRAFRNLLGFGTLSVILANEMSPDGLSPEEYLKPYRGDGPFGDPRKGFNSNFMKFRIAGQDISPYGTWDSLARLVSEAGMGVATGDPGRVAGSARAKASPLVGMAWDLFSGETLMGEEASATDPIYFLRNISPISIRQVTEDIPEAWEGGITDNLWTNIPRAGGQTILEGIGTKTSPVSSYEKAKDVFHNKGDTYKVPNAEGKMETASSYWDLNNAQRARFDEEHPDLAADIKSDPSEELQQYNQVKEMLAKEQQVSDMALTNNELSVDDWREQFNDRRTYLRGAGEALFEGDEEGKPESTGDLYNQVIDENTLPDGSVNWDKVDSVVSKLTPEQQQWIADNRALGMTNLTQRYLATSDERDKYYSLPKYRGYTGDEARQIDDLYDRARATLNLPRGRSAPTMRMLRAIREVSQQYDFGQKVARGARRRVMGMITQVDDRENYLQQNPELAAFVGSGYLSPDEQSAIGGVDTVLRDVQRTR